MDALNDDAISCIHTANLVTSARRENSVSWYAYITLLLILKEFVNPERLHEDDLQTTWCNAK